MTWQIAFLGGNGHCASRLAEARVRAEVAAAIALHDVAYPGFDGRSRASSFAAFLDETRLSIGSPHLVYATGIGGLVALLLRARGRLPAPLVLQAPVLWGLEHRCMPALLRLPGMAHAARRLFALGVLQSWFTSAHFTRPLEGERHRAFFEGYASSAAFADLFAWLGRAVLRELEVSLAARPDAWQGIEIWWGGRDRVLRPKELRHAEQALGRSLEVRMFPDWGHYPMMDVPDEWCAAVAEAAERQCVRG